MTLRLFCKEVHLYCFINIPVYKQYHMVFISLCLTSLSVTVSRFIHVAANGIILFFLWLGSIPLYVCTTSSLSIPLSMEI